MNVWPKKLEQEENGRQKSEVPRSSSGKYPIQQQRVSLQFSRKCRKPKLTVKGTQTLQRFIREDLAVNHVAGEFLSVKDRLRTSVKKQLSTFPDNFYRLVQAT